MIIKTQSGSTYQLDQENKRVRRLHGTQAPTSFQRQDGEYREYIEIAGLEVGKSFVIVWKGREDGFVQPATITSPIVEIDPDEITIN